MITPPAAGTSQHKWWIAGATAEAQARKEGRSDAGLELLEFVDSLAENWHHLGRAEIAAFAFSVYTADLSLWRRIVLLFRWRAFKPRGSRIGKAARIALRELRRNGNG